VTRRGKLGAIRPPSVITLASGFCAVADGAGLTSLAGDPPQRRADEKGFRERHMADYRENVEKVRHLYTAFTNRDIPAILKMLSPAVEWAEPSNPHNPAGGTRRGHEGFLEWVEIGRQSEDILVLEPRKMLADDDSVAVVGFMKCRAIATGKVYESDFVHLVTFEAGKVAKFQEFFDTYAASEAFQK
jgi:ketosteroid isomerase-like protein